jgi:hypothetical protein
MDGGQLKNVCQLSVWDKFAPIIFWNVGLIDTNFFYKN